MLKQFEFMKIEGELLSRIISDLGLNKAYIKGGTIPVRNCWHFSTDGNSIDAMFYNDDDFMDGMNRIYVAVQGYKVIVLAFSLMDTHIHFVLYGPFEECNRFIHDYLRRTSWYISVKYGEKHKLEDIPVSHQKIDSDNYLKTVICYTVKNAPVAGIRYNALDYPWSSGPLYFKRSGTWCSPTWIDGCGKPFENTPLGTREKRALLKTRKQLSGNMRMIGKLVFPGEYVAYELVELLFKTCKSFNYFLCRTKEEDVDARGGILSHLSIPMQEMRQHKNEICKELFGTSSIKGLTVDNRIRLAKVLKARYHSSMKQIARLSGLVYNEVKDLL